MKRVLIVAYYFPPSGGSGVQRVLKYVQYLRDFGWEPVVLTVRDAYFPARDPSLLEEIPRDIKVIRTRIAEFHGFYRRLTGTPKGAAIDVNTLRREGAKRSPTARIAELLRSTFFIPDTRIGWLGPAVRAGLYAIAKEKIDVLYSSSPPYTCALVSRALKRRSRLPWIAGFRDPWTGFITTPKRWAIPAKIDRAFEQAVFQEADAVEVAWRGIMKDALRKYPGLPAEKFHHLPNGLDRHDYPAVPPRARGDDRFTVTYTGSMYGLRNPEAFLEAIEGLVQRGEVDPSRIRLRFVGRFGDDVLSMLRKNELRGVIEVIDYVPHRESVRQLLLADALLLVVDECDDSDEVVPGKVYEYIGARRPIIAVAAEHGAVAELLAETRSGYVADQSNVPGIARAFLTLYHDHLRGRQSLAPDEAATARYERRSITGALAALLDEVVTRPGDRASAATKFRGP